jgi:H+-translocating NAD(P) transhydrogenase subunit alpha
VLVDLAAEQGGNCELTEAGTTVVVGGVSIIGPVNLPSSAPHHASLMYAKNMANFLGHLIQDGAVAADRDDDVIQDTTVARGGEIVNAGVRKALDTREGVAS